MLNYTYEIEPCGIVILVVQASIFMSCVLLVGRRRWLSPSHAASRLYMVRKFHSPAAMRPCRGVPFSGSVSDERVMPLVLRPWLTRIEATSTKSTRKEYCSGSFEYYRSLSNYQYWSSKFPIMVNIEYSFTKPQGPDIIRFGSCFRLRVLPSRTEC